MHSGYFESFQLKMFTLSLILSDKKKSFNDNNKNEVGRFIFIVMMIEISVKANTSLIAFV